jgi:hypothetical protein
MDTASKTPHERGNAILPIVVAHTLLPMPPGCGGDLFPR